MCSVWESFCTYYWLVNNLLQVEVETLYSTKIKNVDLIINRKNMKQ